MTEVVAALIWQDNRFLACQRPAHKARGLMWEFVGGKVEHGETKEQALVRECMEELGIDVFVGDVFWETTHHYEDLSVHLTLFYTTIIRGVPQLFEHLNMKWVHPQDIDEMEFCPADIEILEILKEQYPR